MTLESGLDELIDLKDLELLDIQHMDHGAGVPELEWMVANFPKLQMVIGMLDTFKPPSDEVLESILSHLSQPDLTVCVRVSRAWNKALVPYLWRTLAVYSHGQLSKFLTDEAQRALGKNAILVRELSIAFTQQYDQLLPARPTRVWNPSVIQTGDFAIGFFSNLDSLELCHQNPRTELNQNILALVQQNPRLRRLKIDINMDPSTVMSIVTKYLPALQDLDLGAPWRGDVGALLENLPEGIWTARLGNVVHVVRCNSQSKISVESGVATAMVRRHHALKSLYIHGSLGGHEEEVLLPFLASCSRSLTSVGGIVVCFLGNARIASALSDLGVMCKELNSRSFPQILFDANLAKIISYGSSWTNINLYTRQVGPLAAAAIVENCERLEVLDIMNHGARGLTGSHLQAVLSKATGLRSLQAHWLLEADKISAMDILSSEWATTSLEHMDLKID
ncbi:hypothetical protein BG000_005457, partial [Podila horticola]